MSDYPYYFCRTCGTERPEAFADDRDTTCLTCIEEADREDNEGTKAGAEDLNAEG